jgi:hypothetical protein
MCFHVCVCVCVCMCVVAFIFITRSLRPHLIDPCSSGRLFPFSRHVRNTVLDVLLSGEEDRERSEKNLHKELADYFECCSEQWCVAESTRQFSSAALA